MTGGDRCHGRFRPRATYAAAAVAPTLACMSSLHTQPDAPAIEVAGSAQVLRRARGRPWTSASRSRAARSSACSDPTARARRRSSRSSRATATRSGGDVRVLGIDPATGSRELRERVGIVLQQCGVQNDLSVAELLEMYGRYHVRPPAGRRGDRARRADREARRARQEAVRRPATPARPGAGARRRSGADLPRRADDRL